jgi:hypothetical protein
MAAIYAVSVLLCFKSQQVSSLPYQGILLAHLIWILISAGRSLLIADNYWDYKFLIQGCGATLMFTMIWPLASPAILGKVLKYWTHLALPIFCVFWLFLRTDGYGFYLAPLIVFLLLLFRLSPAQQLLVLGFAAFVVFSNLDARSNILRFSLPIIFSTIYLFRNFLGTFFARTGTAVFFTIPPFLLLLGSSGTFNVFKFQEYFLPEKVELSKENYQVLTADTRTFIYDEVWSSAIRHNYVWTGRSLARGYDSQSFGRAIGKDLGTGRIERYSSEAGIPSLFTWLGAIGVILYSSIFVIAAFLATTRSSSFSLKLIGLFTAFRWSYSWVEEFITFGIQHFSLWMLVAICFSPQFRAMTDKEIGAWLRQLLPLNFRFSFQRNY